MTPTGALDGGGGGNPNVVFQFLKMLMSQVPDAYFPPCHMSNLRNSHVAVSNLRVMGHNTISVISNGLIYLTASLVNLMECDPSWTYITMNGCGPYE